MVSNNNIYYHRADLDGKCSAAIAYTVYGKDANYIGVDYEDNPLDLDPHAERNLFLDFAPFKLDTLPKNVYVIDHHKTAIGMPGIIDTTKAACVLTWEYFYPLTPVPKAVDFIGAADTWQKQRSDWEEISDVCVALMVENWPITNSNWLSLFVNSNDWLYLSTQGQSMRRALNKFQRDAVANQAFEVEFEGLKCIAMVSNVRGSHQFGDLAKQYDAMIVIINVKNEFWRYGLYTEHDHLDLSEIAKKYGGGGHRGAAGWELPMFLFDKRTTV